MAKTINEALKDVFLSLGGNPTALSDNSTVSDYIKDLGDAIKAEVEAELPEVEAANNGQVLAVVDGAWTLCTIAGAANLETGAVTFTFTPVTEDSNT